MAAKHTLYRFFDGDGRLLYVGKTINPTRRFSEHRKDKPWWESVVSITMQHYDSDRELGAAEIVAIRDEKPLHNLQHNSGKDITLVDYLRRDVESANPLPVGAHVALGMTGGRCPVGRVMSADATWVTIQHKCWVSGFYWGDKRSYRVDEIREILYAEDDGTTIYDDDFAPFQTRWNSAAQ